MTEYLAKDYRISALPFEHEDSNSFTLIIRQRPNGKYVVMDTFQAHLTKAGRLIPKWLTYNQVDLEAFKLLCCMDKEEAFRLAREFLPKMTINGFTAKNVQEMDKMDATESAAYAQQLRETRGTAFLEQQKHKTIFYEEEFLEVAAQYKRDSVSGLTEE